MAGKNEKRVKIGDYITYFFIRGLHRLILDLSFQNALRFARVAADLGRLCDRRKRKEKMFRRIREAFPDKHTSDIRRLMRDVYRWLFESVVDALYFHSLIVSGRASEHLEFVNESGGPWPPEEGGVIFVTGHFGSWEVASMALSLKGYKTCVIARPIENPLIEGYVKKHRETQGVQILPKKGAVRGGLKALKNNKNLGILIDQDARYYGIFVDFLGKPASTYSTPAQLSIATGRPVAFVYCMRKGDTDRFKLVLSDVLYPNLEDQRQKEVYRIIQRLTDDLAELVKAYPSRWLWLHRRWKTYPGKYKIKK